VLTRFLGNDAVSPWRERQLTYIFIAVGHRAIVWAFFAVPLDRLSGASAPKDTGVLFSSGGYRSIACRH
jgi:hypothetical protein